MSELRYSTQQITSLDEVAVTKALRSPLLTQGPRVEMFEQMLAEYVGAKYAVAVNSGTAALHVAMAAAGVGGAEGDALVTSSLSFVATANAALMCGDIAIHFEDVDPRSGNAELHDVGYDWVIPVHFAGRASRLVARADYVIEDACHALGAMDFDGCSRVGSCAHSRATCFSFHPVKPITTGEGGAVTTNDEGLRDEMRLLRSHGRTPNGLMVKMGYNYRMTEVAAALGLSQLRRCDEMRDKRGFLASLYSLSLHASGHGHIVPKPVQDGRGAHHLFPVRIGDGRRSEVKRKLNEQGIGAQIHYSPIIPLQPFYRDQVCCGGGDWPNARAWADEELSLPLHAGMTEKDVERVVSALREALL